MPVAPPPDPAANPEPPPRPRRRLLGWVLGVAALAGLLGAALWFALRPGAPDAAGAAELSRTHNRALARLEAGDPAAADPLLVALAEAGESVAPRFGVARLAARNLAVGRVLAVDPEAGAAVPPADRPAWLPRAAAAVAGLEEVEPGAAAVPYFESRLAAAAGDANRREAALLRLAAAAPAAAWPRALLAEAFARSPDPARRDAAGAYLREAVGLEPGNVWLLLNAARASAEGKHPATADLFAALRNQVAPFAEGFAYRQDGGVLPLLDAGEAAARAGDWPAARRNAALALNVLRAEEVARADRLALERHPLDFVATDFPPAFYEAAGLSRTADPAAVPVRYVPFAGPAAPPETPGVRAMAAANLDLLGRDELALLTADAVRVFRRDERGGWAAAFGYDLPDGAGFDGLAAADLDLDSDRGPPGAGGRDAPADACHTADPDLILWGPGGVLLLENRLEPDGSRALTPFPEQEALNALTGVTHAAAVDLDQEGDLDLFVLTEAGPSLWFNRGDTTFEDRSSRSDLSGGAGLKIADVIAVDYDRDVDLDLWLGAAGDGAPAAILENLRHGEFRLHRGTGGALGVELLDADGNASWDAATADGAWVRLHPSVTAAPGRVRWGEPRTLAEAAADRLRAVDHDNDGRVDLLAWGAGGPYLFRDAGGDWEDVSDRLPAVENLSEVHPRDLDGDGDLDLALLAGGRVRLWENRGGEANASLRVALLAEFDKDGTDPKRVNHAGLGSLLELRRGPVYQPAVVRDRVTHFGLGPLPGGGGEGAAGELLRVLWTNGIPEVVYEPESGALCHPQKLGGSCPYLYAWDGARFAFATDLCWAAPIGLQLAEGVFAPTRPWEHVKIDGAALAPRRAAGRQTYDLRVCCELWEAEYFDRVTLTCVDHPPGTHVFTNEKVGPPELVEPHLYAAAALNEPAAARVRVHPDGASGRSVPDARSVRDAGGAASDRAVGNRSGSAGGEWRDVLETVRARDEDYLKPFAAKVTQGYTEPWELELDLSGAPRSGAVLLLTGWVFPTDTGLNVALSQRPGRPGPRPPQLLMETAAGWEPVLPNAGFPGGKTKTIALPLPDFPSEHRRVRLAGTQELYWDRAAWCVPGGVPTEVAPAPLLSAELRYRGFSERSWPASGHGPDRFDYETVTAAQLWPPMAGPFTRYGGVRELLTEADDRQAVLASGDEIALSFAVPPLREGWARGLRDQFGRL